jgi:hypothetical protein
MTNIVGFWMVCRHFGLIICVDDGCIQVIDTEVTCGKKFQHVSNNQISLIIVFLQLSVEGCVLLWSLACDCHVVIELCDCLEDR